MEIEQHISKYLKKEITKKIKIYFELNENANITYHNLWETTKGVYGEKFTALNAQINKLLFYETRGN